MTALKIGISIGDVNGIGPEVVLKTLANRKLIENIKPIIYGSTKAISYHKNILKDHNISFQNIQSADRAAQGKINVINCWDGDINISLGKISEEAGKLAYTALDRATQELKTDQIDALVTAPIHKKSMQFAGFQHIGHTEYLTEAFGKKESLMMMLSENIRVSLVTNHLPIADVGIHITKELISQKLDIFHDSLVKDFGITKPTIAVLGLNPHAGDEGAIGNEENELIRPLIINYKKSGKIVFGPYSADAFFGNGEYRKVDGILAMYHDQGLIPFKMDSFGEGVNYTAGLPKVRTSPDHGTAFDIVGKGIADPGSFRNALYAAIDITRSRMEYDEDRANSLHKKPKQTEEAI